MNKFFRVNSYSFKSIFCFIFFISLLNAEIISAQSTNCSNSNFENGDFSNWQGGTGTPNGNSGNNPGGCCAIVINNFLNSGALLPPRHTITTPSFDPNTLNNLPEVAPGGNFSARIGSWQNSFYQQNNPGPFPGSKSEMLKYTFTVTPNSELFVYKYAVVLEDPDTNVNYHAQNEKPRFEIKVLDANGNYVPNAQCGHYLVTADSNQTGFEQGITTPASVVHYRNWTTVGIDLTAYLGQSITILFQVGDCALGGHFGYAYIDAYCQPLQVLTQYCVGQNQVILTAPPGFSYHWMPGGDTTQTITLNNPVNGSVYTCDLISVTGCVATISTVVQPTSMVPNFNYQVDCNLNTALFADATTIQNGTISNWAWDFGDGSPIMNGVQNPVHTYPGPGSYTVTLTLTTNSGCTSTVTLPVTIPLVAVNAPLSTICSASSVTLTASGGTTYSWTPSIGLSASTGATVAASPTVNTTYTVTVYNANGCSGTTTAVVTIAPNLLVNISAVTDSVCVGHTTTLTAIGGNNYTWSPTLGLSASTGSTVTAHPTSNTTYTVSVSNTAGCTGQASIPIALIPNPGIAVSSQAICAGQSATLNVLGANTYQWSNGSTGGAITVSPVANTSYTVIGFVGACTDTATGIVIVSPLPILNATSSGNICLNGTVTLNANGATNYTWTPSVGFSSSSGSTIVGSPTSNATYTVTGTDLNGCTALTTVNVVVHNPPVIVASASPSILCVGSSTMLTASGTQNYYWSPSTGLAATTGNSILAFPPASTTYTVIGIDTFGCADTVAVPVTISPGPTLNISASNSTICFGANANLNATGANTYSWSPSTGLNVSTGATVTASPAVSTTYFVTAMDSLGCVANAISTVTVNPLPVMTSSATGLICGNGSAQLTATGANTYAWSPSTGLSATTGNNISATISSTTTYTVTGTNLNGCTANSSVTVTVHPIPVIAATPSSAILCTSSSASLTASGGVNYFWSPSTGLSATTGNPIQATPLASSTYSVIGFDANGCSSSSTVSLVVSAGPPLNLVTANPVICIGDSTTLNASGGTNYTWSPSSGLSISTGATVTATPTSTTTYLVSTTDTSGCVASAISIVTVNPLPVLSVVAANPTICFGEATSLTASGANAYAWTPAADLSASTGSTVSANPSVTTTYTIVGSNTFGCTSSIQIIVTVNPLPVLNVIANNPVICFGETTTLNASGAQFYNWSPSNNLSASTGSTVQASPHNSTIFTIIGTDINGCSSATSNSVTVNPLPNLNVTSTDTVLCNLSSATLTATGAAVYTWSPSTGLSASTGNIVQATPSAAITYTVTGTSLFGCIDSTTINIHVNPLPVISVTSSNPAYCPGGSSIITASGANIYNWSPSLGLSATTGDTVIANPSATSVYSVTAIDTNGCSVVSISTVTVNPLPVITPSTSPTICLNQS
ncbi:MAG: PKD domain-containing protein, partial [Bacteroidota bacterium]